MKIAIIGGGPTGMLMLKKLISAQDQLQSIDIFERKDILGAGMPYSAEGALAEHITNVSGNEIPELESSLRHWVASQDEQLLATHGLDREKFNDFKVLPRLLFGRYLASQFDQLLKKAARQGTKVNVHLRSEVTDIIDEPGSQTVQVTTSTGEHYDFDRVVICSGHFWPKTLEGKFSGCFDSPYPPQKISLCANHAVAIRGSSLTAIDGVRTLARSNGTFEKMPDGKLIFRGDPTSPQFRMIMHSRSGLLPAVRFHLEDSQLGKDSVLSEAEIAQIRSANNGFIPLDYVYKRNFLDPLAISHPTFHALIKHLPMEKFVRMMMDRRENTPAFELLRAELAEASTSIKKRESIYWKEMLAVLSFAMNYPAKYFSAEDMARFKTSLMPLISVVIAFAPQGSVSELLALHEAGVLEIISVGQHSEIQPCPTGGIIYHYTDEQGNQQSEPYAMFIDCIGQPHLQLEDLPYPSLVSSERVAPARLRFADQQRARETYQEGDPEIISQNGVLFARVPGIAINDNFQVICPGGSASQRIYMLAVPFIGGYNPDYSGLDFSEAASSRVVSTLFPQTPSLPTAG